LRPAATFFAAKSNVAALPAMPNSMPDAAETPRRAGDGLPPGRDNTNKIHKPGHGSTILTGRRGDNANPCDVDEDSFHG
jgi:hypothetical protein